MHNCIKNEYKTNKYIIANDFLTFETSLRTRYEHVFRPQWEGRVDAILPQYDIITYAMFVATIVAVMTMTTIIIVITNIVGWNVHIFITMIIRIQDIVVEHRRCQCCRCCRCWRLLRRYRHATSRCRSYGFSNVVMF